MRVVKDGSETPFQEIWRAYNNWHANNSNGPKLNQAEFTKKLDEEFGEGLGKKKVYRHIRIVGEDDEEEE